MSSTLPVQKTYLTQVKNRLQINDGASVSVMNLIGLLHNFKLFNEKIKNNVCMYGDTSKQIITPHNIVFYGIR